MSDLRTWQRAVESICLDPAPDAAVFAAVGGNEARWRLYRTMVRTRFQRVLRDAAPRLTKVIGEDPMHDLIDAFLAQQPPQSRLLRDLVGEFHAWCTSTRFLDEPATEAIGYDAAVIHARDALDVMPATDASSFGFDHPANLSASCRLLRLSHGAHRDGDATRGPEWVLVYRHGDTHDPRWLVLSPLEAEIVRAWSEPHTTAAEAAMMVAKAAGVPVNEAFAGVLGDLAARLLTRGALRCG